MTNKSVQGLGVAAKDGEVFLYCRHLLKKSAKFQIQKSSDGLTFSLSPLLPEIRDKKGQSENIAKTSDYRISRLANNSYFLTYKLEGLRNTPLCGATSTNLTNWQKIGKLSPLGETGMVVPSFQYGDKYLLYFGEDKIKIALSTNLKKWTIEKNPVLVVPPKQKIKIGNLAVNKDGFLLSYFGWEKERSGKTKNHCLKLVLLDRKDPTKILWKSDKPIWEQPFAWESKTITPVGALYLDEEFISYWEISGEGIFAIKHYPVTPAGESKFGTFLPMLRKFDKNPIMRPIMENYWESQAVFNPAAIWEDGKVHLVYRAVGDSNVSVFGYASSFDGIRLDTRLAQPIYTPREEFEYNSSAPCSLSPYASGPGYGGCEDPRITKIGRKIYLTYTAWNGYQPPRVALTSIKEGDFLKHRWNWEKSVAISPPDETHKNWVLFPEKIKGRYAILHSLTPKVGISYFDDLDFDGQSFIESSYLPQPRKNYWDTIIRGVGPPPIRIQDGWLIIYHAATYDCGYKVGAMILDEENPEKILYRSISPILEPDSWYENEGLKPRIVYCCGAVVLDNHLLLYYGGADQYVCLATSPLDKFLKKLKTTGRLRLEPVMVKSFN